MLIGTSGLAQSTQATPAALTSTEAPLVPEKETEEPDLRHRLLDEITFGALESTKTLPKTPYFSNRLGGSVDASEEVRLRLDTTFTHYDREAQTSATNVFQLLFGGTWEPNDHLSFDGDVYWSPQSATVTSTPRSPGVPAERSTARTSSGGAAISGEYDTATDGDFDTAVDLTLGVTRYSTTQAMRLGRGLLATGTSEKEALVQARASLGVTETILLNTDVGLVGTYYLYNRDPTQSGYYGASVFGRGVVSDGIPLEPMRWSVRPTVLERFGAFHVIASFQYAGDVDSSGHSVLFGLKLQYKFSRVVKAWVSAYHQAETLPSSEVQKIDFGSLGATVSF